MLQSGLIQSIYVWLTRGGWTHTELKESKQEVKALEL